MHQERTVQATIFEVFAGHEIGCELNAISQWQDRQRALVSLLAGDLCREWTTRDRPPRPAGGDVLRGALFQATARVELRRAGLSS
jgi:hypothetical protein